MKAMTSRNLRGKYSGSIPGPLRVKPVLASSAKAINAIRIGSKGRMSMKAAKTGDCSTVSGIRSPTNCSNCEMKALEKIGVRKGSIKRNSEIAKPTMRVFHEYLLVYSIEDMFV